MKKLISKVFFSNLAKRAVESAESNFGPGKGLAKKRFAVNFVLARLGIPSILRAMFEDVIVELIGIAVEDAVEYMNRNILD